MTRRLAAVPDEPRRALGLIRVSKAKGRDDLVSPEIQRASIEDYAARAGIQVVRWKEALDESASSNRSRWWATLDQAVELVEARQIDAVLVWKFSRAARHRRRWAVALDRIEVAGGTIESATEGLDTTTSTGRLGRGILSELSVWEAEVRSESWKEAHANRLRHGLPHSGRARFGYDYIREPGREAKFVPNSDADLLKAAYRRYADGASLRTVAAWLNSRGSTTTGGRQWTNGVLGRVLDSGFAAGLITAGGRDMNGRMQPRTWSPGAQEPVISKSLWEQYLRARERADATPARTKARATPLAGLVYCFCGARCHIVTKGGRSKYRQYMCSAYRLDKSCPGAWINLPVIEEFVKQWVATIAELQTVPPEAAVIATRAAAKSDRALLVRAVAQADAALQRLAANQARTPLPLSIYDRTLAELVRDRDIAEAALAANRDSDQAQQVKFGPILARWGKDATPEEINALLRPIVRKVIVARREEMPRVRVVPMWES